MKGVIVKNCTFKGAAYGARINARQTDKPSEISNIVFEDLVMDQTLNPISIKQDYLPIPDKVHLHFCHVYYLHKFVECIRVGLVIDS